VDAFGQIVTHLDVVSHAVSHHHDYMRVLTCPEVWHWR